MKRSLVFLCLTGCMVGPDYERPALQAPAGWAEQADAQAADLARWWTRFGDRALDGLVARAAAANKDLKIAEARFREARAQVGTVAGKLLPEVGAGGSYTRSELSANGLRFPIADLTESRYAAGFDAAWELDLFGGTRRAIEALEADADAWAERRNTVLVSVLGDVVLNYVGVRGDQRLLAALRSSAVAARDSAALTRSRVDAGVATDLDLQRSEALRASVEAAIPPVEAALRAKVYRLGVLLGGEPASLLVELGPDGPIPAVPARIVVGMPSELLLRRPDVREAERRLHSQTARIGVATAELFPKISLTGAFGWESLSGDNLFKSASQAWSWGPSIRWPIFTAGRIRAQIRVEEERQIQALAAFEQSILRALEDVENGLVVYARSGARKVSLAEAVGANRKAVELAEMLNGQGIVSFLDVLEAQRALYVSEAELARSEAEVVLALVALYKSLGGGWESAP